MKKKHYVFLFLLVFAVLAFVCCHNRIPKQYKLRQSMDNVVSVKIMDGNNYDKKTKTHAVLKALDVETGKKLINELLTLKGGTTQINKYLDLYSPYVEIVYADGEIEMIGPRNNFWVTIDGKEHHGNYSFEEISIFYDILYKYC